MKQSKLFIKTRKEAPADEVSKNAELLIRGGFINKEMAGVYSYLPMGLLVMNKISNIIREEMDAIGGQEIKMTVLQDSESWKKSGRWSDDVVDNWFKTKLKNETELGLGFTHEEPITAMLKNHINSYRDLPVYVYQIQAKFRNETRAKSGVMRGREFLMKDMYSFSKNEEEHNAFYEKVQKAYKKVYERLGLGHLTYMTFASGGTFSKYSHEFQTITSAGEDTIYVDEEKGIAVNQEVLNDEVLNDLNIKRESLVEHKAVEVGNIFTLGYKFSEPINLTYKDESGNEQKVFMGSYGIGPSRLMGTIVEVLSDEKGIIWPKEVSPFHAHLVSLGENEKAEELYNELKSVGVDVLLDDRDAPAGEKFGDSDLLGIPLRVVVSKRSLEEGGYEIKYRKDEKGKIVSKDELVGELKEYVSKAL
jgi:prolyl-tRNA synthetase